MLYVEFATVAACTVSTKKVIPSVAVHHGSSFAVNGDVQALLPGMPKNCFWIESISPLYCRSMFRTRATTGPIRGIKKKCRINSVAVFDTIRGGNYGVVFKSEVWGFGSSVLVHMNVDIAGMPA